MRFNFNIHGLAFRLTLFFLAILGLFVVTLLVTLQTLDGMETAELKLGRLDRAKHMGHSAANDVRELYIHQMHTLIEWDASHLSHYHATVVKAQKTTDKLSSMVVDAKNVARVREIETLAQRVSDQFRDKIVPMLESEPRAAVDKIHRPIETMVEKVIELSEELNQDLEMKSDRARADAEAQRADAKTMVIICCGLAVILAAMVGLLLIRAMLKPIGILMEASYRVAEGDLQVVIEPLGRGEFGDLAESFNRMVADLKSHQVDLLRSHRLASIGQLAAGVAHEINNPLGVILGYAKLLARDAPEEMNDELRIIEDEATQCQAIVRSLLDLARPDVLAEEIVDLVGVVNAAVDHLIESGLSDNRSISRPSRTLPLTVNGDTVRIRQVVLNLLSNALQSHDGAHVTLDVGQSKGRAFLSVCDDGPGIEPETLEQVMEPFFTTKATGTGLGLAISQNIIHAHGGSLEVSSTVGIGTTVTMWVPSQQKPGEG